MRVALSLYSVVFEHNDVSLCVFKPDFKCNWLVHEIPGGTVGAIKLTRSPGLYIIIRAKG